MLENSRRFMKCQTETRHLVKSAPNCLSSSMPRHFMECPSAGRYFPNHSIKRLLVEAGGEDVVILL